MSIVSIPYQYINGKSVIECGSSCTSLDLLIDNSTNDLCGEKYFELRIISVQQTATGTLTIFSYNGDLYGSDTLPNTLITLFNQCFTCTPTGTCGVQDCKFDWKLTPISAIKYLSNNIVDEYTGSNPNYVYEFTTLDINGVVYPPSIFWDDTVDGKACENTALYIDTIIAYIEAQNIPEYIGSINKAKNGQVANGFGTNLLEVYFDSGISGGTISIQNTTAVIVGSIATSLSTVTSLITLKLSDNSVIDAGDSITAITWNFGDGITTRFNTQIGVDPIINVWSLFNSSGLNIDSNWVLGECIVTENECVFDNFSQTIIPNAKIQLVITTQSTEIGSSI